MNCVVITGRFTSNPELHTTKDGKQWTRFTIAVPTSRVKNIPPDFIRCAAWGDVALFICGNFQKGKKIEIKGELRSNEIGNGDDRRTTTEVHVEQAYYGEKKSQE